MDSALRAWRGSCRKPPARDRVPWAGFRPRWWLQRRCCGGTPAHRPPLPEAAAARRHRTQAQSLHESTTAASCALQMKTPRHGAAPGPRRRSHFLRLRCCPRPKAAPSCSWHSHSPGAEPNAPSGKGSAPRPSPTPQRRRSLQGGCPGCAPLPTPAVCSRGARGVMKHPGGGGRLAACRRFGRPQPFRQLRLNQGRWRVSLLSVLSGLVSALLSASKQSQVLRRAREKVLTNKRVTAEGLLGFAAARQATKAGRAGQLVPPSCPQGRLLAKVTSAAMEEPQLGAGSNPKAQKLPPGPGPSAPQSGGQLTLCYLWG